MQLCKNNSGGSLFIHHVDITTVAIPNDIVIPYFMTKVINDHASFNIVL